MKDNHTGGIDLEGAAELWQTPKAMDTGNPRALETRLKNDRQERDPNCIGNYKLNLMDQVGLWQTPQVDSFRSRSGNRKDEMGLDQQARLQWVTPASQDWKGANSEAHVTETGRGRKRVDQLSNLVEHSFRPDQPTESDGRKSSPKDRTSRQPSAKKRLNSRFVEWLMGMPEGWVSSQGLTNYEDWVTRSSLNVRRLLCSYLSTKSQRMQDDEDQL